MKNFLLNKKSGFYFAAAGILFALVGLISYSIAGTDSYGFVPMVDVLLAIGIALGVLFAYRDFFGIGSMVMIAFFGSALGVFINSRFMYYSHQFYGIASDPITGAMVVTTIAFIGMIVCVCISAFLGLEKGGDKE